MADNKKRAVGLIILTEIPAMGGLVAVLQRRGKLNHEKMEPETRPGGCQVTVHGKVEEVDSIGAGAQGTDVFREALLRESYEEIGLHFLEAANELSNKQGNLVDCMELLLVDDTPTKEVRTYGLYVVPEVFEHNCIRLNASSGGLEFVTREGVDKIRNLNEFDKRIGVTDLNTIAMFPDEIKAVQKAFEVFGK